VTPLLKELDKAQIAYTIYQDTVPNPTITNVEEAKALYLENHCQSIIGFGGGCVNDTIVHLSESSMGFGGVGHSGMGTYHGRKSFETFTHQKYILKKYNWLDLPMRYQPYKAFYLKLIRFFLH